MPSCFDNYNHRKTTQNSYLIQKKLYSLTKTGVNNGVQGYELYLLKKNCGLDKCSS